MEFVSRYTIFIVIITVRKDKMFRFEFF